MRKRKYALIVLTFLLSNMVVVLLFAYSQQLSKNKSAFIRFLPPHIIGNFHYRDLRFNSFYIAGLSSQYIFLGNHMAQGKYMLVSTDLKDTMIKDVALSDSIRADWQHARLVIDSEDFYLGEGNTPIILKGNFKNNQLQVCLTGNSKHFDRVWLPLSPSSFIARKYDSIGQQNDIFKITGLGMYMKKDPILQKQLDGKFCTDGNLVYDKTSRIIVYIYTYRNQFIALDTNLQIIARYKTIDTVSRVQFTLDTVYKESRVTFSSPPHVVNKRAAVWNGMLFIHSANYAANEEISLRNNPADIDIYNLKDGRYLYSFQVATFRTQKIKEMTVGNNRIFFLLDNMLVSYDLRLPQKL